MIQAVSPNAITTTENVGRAMIQVALHGAPSKWVENKQINELADQNRAIRPS